MIAGKTANLTTAAKLRTNRICRRAMSLQVAISSGAYTLLRSTASRWLYAHWQHCFLAGSCTRGSIYNGPGRLHACVWRTGSSAIAEGPRDALCPLKYYYTNLLITVKW